MYAYDKICAMTNTPLSGILVVEKAMLQNATFTMLQLIGVKNDQHKRPCYYAYGIRNAFN